MAERKKIRNTTKQPPYDGHDRMRAIIIDDKDCQALVDALKLESLRKENYGVSRKNPDEPATLEEVHRVFHYVVVRWLQSQGWKSH